MTIACTSQTSVVCIEGGYGSVQPENIPEEIYVQAQFDNGYQCYIPFKWGTDEIARTIQSVIDAFDSDAPPQNWKPYA